MSFGGGVGSRAPYISCYIWAFFVIKSWAMLLETLSASMAKSMAFLAQIKESSVNQTKPNKQVQHGIYLVYSLSLRHLALEWWVLNPQHQI